MAENESLTAVPQESSASAIAVPPMEDGELLVPAQGGAPAIEQPTADPAEAEASAQSVREGDVKPLGLISPVH
ncbi:hypothetical protein P3T37_004404 [Kitasatospora sp. MAA4]|nr:hypothetical protein [Kitasatospora sp. MAA4]